ncbi:unnamed protein product [Litomosoides sigmodontis]|uniref:sphingomyelin phosphodiesterase n=1 Tax=Litomosoides sigmodontis TaxID=42156 RepID=A0A3P6TPY9_LITSI|nr:unnamed protein product [Litomosoides sigmodontis]
MRALPLPWPFGSRDHHLRIRKIGEALLQDEYDIIALEEGNENFSKNLGRGFYENPVSFFQVWGESDFLRLQEMLKETYTYNYYFHSGFTGSGICVFSRHPIVSTLMHRFTLNGFAHHIHRGDWFGGKGVGLVEIEIEQYRINFYAAHLHAEYDSNKDLYLPHRLAQAFELAQFVKHTSYSANALILAGDFNIESDNLAYDLIMKNANLKDAWIQKPNKCDDCGATFERLDNCYTPQRLKNKKTHGNGKRLDYIMYGSGRSKIELKLCEIRMNRVHDQKSINYSDHAGIYAEFFVSEHYNEALTVRFVFTLLIGFCLWHGFIGLTLEHKALKASKASVSMLLND